MFVLNKVMLSSRAEWSEMPNKTQPFETVSEKYSSNDVRKHLLTEEKTFTMITLKNPRNYQLHATATTKKKHVTTKLLLTRSTFRQSLVASVGESQVVDKILV